MPYLGNIGHPNLYRNRAGKFELEQHCSLTKARIIDGVKSLDEDPSRKLVTTFYLQTKPGEPLSRRIQSYTRRSIY